MRTTYRILRPNGQHEAREVEWPADPTYHQIERLIKPLLGGEDLEHVNVTYRGERADMFVCENGKLFNMPRNETATGIYRTDRVRPGRDPESVSYIVGVAIVFDRKVWT